MSEKSTKITLLISRKMSKKYSSKFHEFMKKISEIRDQSKGQFNKLLSSPIQTENCHKEHHANKEKVSSQCFTKQEKTKILKYEKELGELKGAFQIQSEEFKVMKNLLDQMREIVKDQGKVLKNELVDLKKIVEDQATKE